MRAGDAGASLAFAPGNARGSALPGERGTAVVSGHRDTHVRFLAQLRVGYLQVCEIVRDHFDVVTRILDGRQSLERVTASALASVREICHGEVAVDSTPD